MTAAELKINYRVKKSNALKPISIPCSPDPSPLASPTPSLFVHSPAQFELQSVSPFSNQRWKLWSFSIWNYVWNSNSNARIQGFLLMISSRVSEQIDGFFASFCHWSESLKLQESVGWWNSNNCLGIYCFELTCIAYGSEEIDCFFFSWFLCLEIDIRSFRHSSESVVLVWSEWLGSGRDWSNISCGFRGQNRRRSSWNWMEAGIRRAIRGWSICIVCISLCFWRNWQSFGCSEVLEVIFLGLLYLEWRSGLKKKCDGLRAFW